MLPKMVAHFNSGMAPMSLSWCRFNSKSPFPKLAKKQIGITRQMFLKVQRFFIFQYILGYANIFVYPWFYEELLGKTLKREILPKWNDTNLRFSPIDCID